MGFLRKGLFVASGGLSGAAGIKANSKKERTAKAMEAQLRLQKQAMRANRPAAVPKAQKAAIPTAPVAMAARMSFRLANYDGGFPSYPTKEGNGELTLTNNHEWELHFTGKTTYVRGTLYQYPMQVTATGSGSCRVTMTDAKDPSTKVSFDLLRTPAPGFLRALTAYFPPLSVGAGPTAAPRVTTQVGVADEIAKLAELRKQGFLTDDEFNAQKSKLLESPASRAPMHRSNTEVHTEAAASILQSSRQIEAAANTAGGPQSRAAARELVEEAIRYDQAAKSGVMKQQAVSAQALSQSARAYERACATDGQPQWEEPARKMAEALERSAEIMGRAASRLS